MLFLTHRREGMFLLYNLPMRMYSIIIIIIFISVLYSQSWAMWWKLDPSLSEQPVQLLLQSRVGSSQASHHLWGPNKVVLDPFGCPAWQTNTHEDRELWFWTPSTFFHFSFNRISVFLCYIYLMTAATELLIYCPRLLSLHTRLKEQERMIHRSHIHILTKLNNRRVQLKHWSSWTCIECTCVKFSEKVYICVCT